MSPSRLARRRAVDPHPADHLVEIGPGRGALTAALLASHDGTLDAIEIDRDLAAQLRARFAAAPHWTLHEGDALRFDYRALAHARGGRLRTEFQLTSLRQEPECGQRRKDLLVRGAEGCGGE